MVSCAGSHNRPGQSAVVAPISASAAESCGLDGREERVKGEEEGIRVNIGAQRRMRQEDATFPRSAVGRTVWSGGSCGCRCAQPGSTRSPRFAYQS